MQDMKQYWPLALALVLFSLLAYHLNFTQDDAYITYRYVANYVNGDGLVFNVGERIEGFTNFGWTVYLLLWGVLGANFILISKVTGLLFGAGVIVLTVLVARRMFDGSGKWFVVIVAALLGSNQSLAYWSPAGLETAAFAFFALGSLYSYLRRSRLLIFTLVMAVWLRPEGAVVTGIIILIELIQHRRLPRFTLTAAAVAFLFSLPMVGFKLAYYGSILPNPFYAKTSFSFDQLSSGVEYTGRFLNHYAFYYTGAALLVLPLVWWRRLSEGAQAVWLYLMIYMAYVTLIGGDVLKVHRFFIPTLGPLAIVYALMIKEITGGWKRGVRTLVVAIAALAMIGLSYELPRDFVDKYNTNEKAFTAKMEYKARELRESDSGPFSVAVATIGIFGYELLGHDIIDLVGLTDSTIARYSEDPIPGMETTWKEQKHNSRYLLERGPDYIMFSTGIKPSAPAERALLLYRQFMDSYRTVGWYYVPPGASRGVVASVFKKVRPIEGEIVPAYPVEYVEEYKQALDYHTRADYKTAILHYDRAARASPQPYFVYLIYQKAFSLMMLGEIQQAAAMMDALLVRDSMVFEAHMDLYRLASFVGDTAKASAHRRWLQKLVPWYWPRVDSATREMLRAMPQGGSK
jgi:tetratricopeptide (TPR) repeat protein